MVGHTVLHPPLFIGIGVISGAMLFHGPLSYPSEAAESAPVVQIPRFGSILASSSTILTIWEQTTVIGVHVFQMDDVISSRVSFITSVTVSEIYSVTSDGTYFTINCYKVPPEPMNGIGTGNNTVAVRLNGVQEHPEGLYMIPVFLTSEKKLIVKVRGVWLPALSAIGLFSIGFLVQDEVPLYNFLVRIVLFSAGAAYFYLIGRDVFDVMYARLKGALSRIHAYRTGG